MGNIPSRVFLLGMARALTKQKSGRDEAADHPYATVESMALFRKALTGSLLIVPAVLLKVFQSKNRALSRFLTLPYLYPYISSKKPGNFFSLMMR